jgi:asparagine N-glycosylation enzyme membrane subunit Stt3
MTTLGVNYAAAFIIALLWDWPDPDSELYIYITAIFIVSLLFGALISDMRKTFLYVMGSMAIGIFLATFILSAPSLTLTETLAFFDISITIALTGVIRFFILGVTFMVIGVIVGCFMGDALARRLETSG